MRLAYELGFANSCLFTRDHVTFLSLDGISFARPVPIGSLLRLTSNIVHSSSSEQYPALVVRTLSLPTLYHVLAQRPTADTILVLFSP